MSIYERQQEKRWFNHCLVESLHLIRYEGQTAFNKVFLTPLGHLKPLILTKGRNCILASSDFRIFQLILQFRSPYLFLLEPSIAANETLMAAARFFGKALSSTDEAKVEPWSRRDQKKRQ